jgi:hypothetical protein
MKLDKLDKLNKLEQIQAAEARLLLSTYDRNPILFVRGEGVHIIDEQGERYLDLLSGIGVNALGPGGACTAAHGAHRPGSRLLFEHRYRGLGGRTQAGTRACRTHAQRR